MADTLTVETGAVVAGADSYNTLAQLDTHFTNYGAPSSGWTGETDAAKCALARVATRWMEARWGEDWTGSLSDTDTPQALSWPRDGAFDSSGREFDSDEIPGAITRLHAEVTRLAAEGKLQTSDLKRGGLVASVSAGPVSKSFFPHASGKSSYPYLDGIARPLTNAGVSGNRLWSNGG